MTKILEDSLLLCSKKFLEMVRLVICSVDVIFVLRGKRLKKTGFIMTNRL